MTTHALYRFFDQGDELLYIGITVNPGSRWNTHRADKPWWTDVARITVETYPDRPAVLAAEKAAIVAEHPRHNIVHRGAAIESSGPAPHDCRVAPFQPGDWVALGLRDGRCPVGGIEAMDEMWVSVRLKSFWDGYLTDQIVAVRWDEIERVWMAYPEDRVDGAMQDEHLGEFQSAWKRTRLGAEGDPVEEASQAIRGERARERAAERRSTVPGSLFVLGDPGADQ